MSRWQRIWLVGFIYAVGVLVSINATQIPAPATMIASFFIGFFGSAFVLARNP